MKNLKMMYRSHRGGVYYTPENTMPAFEDALKKGFEYIETDPQYTKDGSIILMHDDTINRTCRNSDGSKIEERIAVNSITYEELLGYDAGIAWGEQFKGVKVPLLDELLSAAEESGTIIALDKKIRTDRIGPLLDLIAKYDTKVCFSTSDCERIRRIQARFPDAMFDYDVNISEAALREVTSLVKPENLIVWLYMDKPNFSWLADKAKVSKERCELVKRYARLGIANINNPYDVMEALEFDPDVLEV
ncbi:MAG: hypothetical protein IJF16_05735 [Clostridia bacterium]|nr:hypothetical protein [Clostridia bacterium]